MQVSHYAITKVVKVSCCLGTNTSVHWLIARKRGGNSWAGKVHETHVQFANDISLLRSSAK